MKLQKLSFVLLLTVLFGLTFSSCDDDDYYTTVRATLDIDTSKNPMKTSNNGRFSFYYDIYYNDIQGLYYNENVRNVYLYSSELWLGVDNPYLNVGDRITFTLEGDNSGSFTTNLQLGVDKYGLVAYINEGNPNYANFMERLISQVIYNGSARLYVSGNAYDSQLAEASWISLTIQNNIDVEVYD